MRFPDAERPYSGRGVTGYLGSAIGEQGPVWRVLALDGSEFSEVRLPLSFHLLEIGGDYLLGLEKDELDREAVVMLALAR